MNKEQENAFWEVIRVFNDLGILKHVMVIGSWAEYLYPPLFETNFIPNIRTRDVDFFYRNLNIPKNRVPFIEAMKDQGFLCDTDPYSEITKFYKEDLLELEFLTQEQGSGSQDAYEIRSLGIKSEGLRVINILNDFACEIELHGYTITVPEPAVYVIQKLLTNPTRRPATKKEKDIYAVQELLVHIKQSDYHMAKLKEIYGILTKKQLRTLSKVVDENFIDLFS